MIATAGGVLELGAAGVLLVVVVVLFRELAVAHRWGELIRALHRLAAALERFEVVELVDEADDEAPPA